MSAIDALANPFTGVVGGLGGTARRPHDPTFFAVGGVGLGRDLRDRATGGGAGWTRNQARAAAVGEAIERMDIRRCRLEQRLVAQADRWPKSQAGRVGGAPIAPERFVRFAAAQYRLPDFPFEPMTSATKLEWLRCRRVTTGEPVWVPGEAIWLDLRHDAPRPRFGPMVSTGLAAGPTLEQAIHRGLQEVVERDALVGAWWGAYPLERWSTKDVMSRWASHQGRDCGALRRPNLCYGFYRVLTPYADNVVLATLEGLDDEGFIFSFGAACRSNVDDAIDKALLEALQGRLYVRYLVNREPAATMPRSFAEHATFYSHFPDQLTATPLARATNVVLPQPDPGEGNALAASVARVEPKHPVLFRVMTPRGIAESFPGWVVVRVVVPGLQPLHGHHGLPFLGGPMWGDRPVSDYNAILPHPLP